MMLVADSRTVFNMSGTIVIQGSFLGERFEAVGRDETEAELNEIQAMVDILQIKLYLKKQELGYESNTRYH